MSLITREDRDTVHAMHHAANGTGSSASEVSRKRPVDDSSRKTPWTRPASVIQIPGSHRYPSTSCSRNSAVGNPFQQSQFDSLHGKASPSRNPSTAALVVPLSSRQFSGDVSKTIYSDIAPAPKRQRLGKKSYGTSRGDKSSSPMGSTSLTGKLQKTRTTASSSNCESTDGRAHDSRSSMSFASDDPLGLTTPTTQSEVIPIEDDEDVRESARSLTMSPSISSDDMQLISTRDCKSSPNSVGEILCVPKPSDDHAFNEPIRKQHNRPPPSGPHTRAVRTQVKNHVSGLNGTDIDDEPEAIENPDDFDNLQRAPDHSERRHTQLGSTAIPQNRVRQSIELYEARAHPPELDLKIVGKNKSRVGSMKKDLMSGQKRSQGFHLDKLPPIGRSDRLPPLSSSTMYKSHKNSSKQVILPLEAYACGFNIIQSVDSEDSNPKYWLRVRGNHVSIMRRPIEHECSVVDLELPQDICGVAFPDNDADIESFALFKLTLTPTLKVKKFFKTTNDDEKMILTIKPLMTHVNWSVDGFKTIRNIIKSTGTAGFVYLRATSLSSIWTYLLYGQDGVRPGPSETRVTRSKPYPQANYAGAAQTSYSPTSSEVRRSSRQVAGTTSARSPSPPVDEIILLYPPSGPGAVNVTVGDLKRLEPGEFLNDTLIELGLKLWLNDLRDHRPEFADQVHVFSSFFYTQLNHKNFDEGYQSVRKWTSKFDLFRRKYIIIPINEHMHWYLAIICHPERILQHPSAQVVTPNVTTRTRAHESSAMRDAVEGSTHHPEQLTATRPPSSKGSTASRRTEDEQEVEQVIYVAPVTMTSGPMSPSSSSSPFSSVTAQHNHKSDGMEIVPETDSEGEENAMKVTSTEPALSSSSQVVQSIPPIHWKNFYQHAESRGSTTRNSVRIAAKHDEEEEIDQLQDDDHMDVDVIPSLAAEPDRQEVPYIFSFDSLGTRHPHALKVLARYLGMEAKDKKGWDDTVQPIMKQASVPPQPNYCDCGVYLLHFVEQFMSDPETFSQQILQHQKSKKSSAPNKLERERLWSHDKVAGRREEMKQRIISLSAQWKLDKQTDSKGKGSEEIQDQPRETNIDLDSDIEVVEISPRPSKSVKPIRINKAVRLR